MEREGFRKGRAGRAALGVLTAEAWGSTQDGEPTLSMGKYKGKAVVLNLGETLLPPPTMFGDI